MGRTLLIACVVCREESSDCRILRRLDASLWELVAKTELGGSLGRVAKTVKRGKWSDGKGSSAL